MASIERGVSNLVIIPLVDPWGNPNTTAVPTCYIAKATGDLVAATNAPVRKTLPGVVDSHVWHLVLTDTEMNTLPLHIYATATGCVPVDVTIYPDADWTAARAAYLTGDAFTRIGAGGASLTALGDARLAKLDATVASRLASADYTAPANDVIAAIQERTDNLPDAPASEPGGLPVLDQTGLLPGLGVQALDALAVVVWQYSTRTLTSLASLVGDIAATVWGYARRVLTDQALLVLAPAGVGGGGARSLRDLAVRGKALYQPDNGESTVPWEIRLEEAWREFVRQAGGSFRKRAEVPLEPGVREFALPGDYRELLLGGVYLAYVPRGIASASRSGGVVTLETTAAHSLLAEVTVRIEGCEGFDGDFEVAAAPDNTHITYADNRANAVGSGGYVKGVGSAQGLQVWPEALVPPIHEAQPGLPMRYWFPDTFTIAVEPVSNGCYPALYLEYDAEAPAEWSLTAKLPAPSYIEAGLMAYAAAQLGAIPIPQGMTDFERAVRAWRAARSKREDYNRREPGR